jgi:RTX calcium-binding nonapeptide repeat (4 copies)
VFGDSGVDSATTADGDDLLSGGGAGDRLYGGDGADTMMGGADNDLISGGWSGNGTAGHPHYVGDTVSYANAAYRSHREVVDSKHMDRFSRAALPSFAHRPLKVRWPRCRSFGSGRFSPASARSERNATHSRTPLLPV